MADDISKKLDGIIAKLNKFKKDYKSAKEENKKLKEDSNTLVEQANLNAEKVKELEKELNLVKVSKILTDNNLDNKTVKKQINEYIKELDKCIALLNN